MTFTKGDFYSVSDIREAIAIFVDIAESDYVTAREKHREKEIEKFEASCSFALKKKKHGHCLFVAFSGGPAG